MFLKDKICYTYNDVALVPSICSTVNSRKECITCYKDGKLPLFVSPMSSIIDINNFYLFNNTLHAILPRNIDYQTRLSHLINGDWVAFSLQEFISFFCDDKKNLTYKANVLIDIANGHMCRLYEQVKIAKKIHGNKLCIMVGNIANPLTYKEAYEAGVDYIRIGIGAGSGCITSSNTGIHYPMASLIYDTFMIKEDLQKDASMSNKKLPYIVADGGIRNYSDVIKALSLGADYVMIGSLFASLIESSGEVYKCIDKEMIKIEKDNIEYGIKNNKEQDNIFYKKFYGMASKEGQIDINGGKKKTSEGICKYIPVTTTLSKWIENMSDYIKSAMSYLGIKDVYDMNPLDIDIIIISKNTQESINK